MSVAEKIIELTNQLVSDCTLVAVSKTKPNTLIMEAYNTGHRDFGENKVQELVAKFEALPKDIRWHMIGHLQRNKVKYIAPFVHLIHGVDSLRLLREINKQGVKSDRVINCLLQVHIANEDTKFGFEKEEITDLFANSSLEEFQNVKITGLMGMATNTSDQNQVLDEFSGLKNLYDEVTQLHPDASSFKILSMGMSSDYHIALDAGSNMVRIGSSIFGSRDY